MAGIAPTSVLKTGPGYFSADYATARQRFRAAAHSAGAALHALPLDAKGPGGEALTIDIAWLGNPRPQRVLLHTSGLHGVEAFAGSAVQLHLLERPPAIPADSALLLVHVLNPYGMAWLRRSNENNVDLNRNFLKQGEAWSGAPALYRDIDAVLNPASAPGCDLFHLRAAWLALRHGFHPLKQAVAEGQYEFPRGLFYGGSQLEAGPRLYLSWLARYLKDVDYMFALDVHTGLGEWGTDTLIPEPAVGVTATAELSLMLGRALIETTHGSSVSYTVRGSMGGILPQTLPATRIDFLLQEIGTYPPRRVLYALREENRWHYHGHGGLRHAAKLRLREALCPASAGWQRQAVARGVTLAYAVGTWIFIKK